MKKAKKLMFQGTSSHVGKKYFDYGILQNPGSGWIQNGTF